MNCKLYVGLTSKEVLDAVLKVNTDCGESRIAIAASVGQVGDGSYTGLTLDDVSRLHRGSAMTRPHVERDHLGRDQSSDEWLESDGPVWERFRREYDVFDSFHLHSTDMTTALRAMSQLSCCNRLQIGPGEGCRNTIVLWPRDKSDFMGWVSAPFGTRVRGTHNTNKVLFDEIEHARKKFPFAKIRCHACDYLPRRTLRAVKALVDGVNVAPQLGVAQSLWYLSHAKQRGLCIDAWVDACLSDDQQMDRWNLEPAHWYGVGHYHFDKIEWRADARDAVVSYLAEFIKELDDA